MRLDELAAAVPGTVVGAGGEHEVTRIAYNSGRTGPGDLFVAVRGLRVDGHAFAADAAGRGAAVALEHDLALPAGTPWLRLPDTREGLAELAAALAGRPARQLLVAGVTGTDGKTTVTHMAAHVLEAAGVPAGFLSTVAHRAGAGSAAENRSGQTTMEAPEVQQALAGMVSGGLRAAVVEATSHALLQGRVGACDFDVAAFTNVGRDHLDYHGGWEDYLRAKARLIGLCAAASSKGVPKTAVLNVDDASFEYLASLPIERRLAYSLRADQTAADLRALDLAPLPAGGTRFRLAAGRSAPGGAGEAEVRLRLPAAFNVANACCAAGVGLALGLALEAVAEGLSGFPGLRGRLEPVELGQPFSVYVDFAHSAGSLAGVLAELRLTARGGRLLAVFGSTGRADHDRPGMGRAAAAGADWFVITTDDPVDEDPSRIAGEVESGVAGRRRGLDYQVELDRRAAIRLALGRARPGDVVLLAGKGHETTMVVAGGRRLPWDDRAEAEAALRELGLAQA